jgi:hypothetical protein
LLKVTGTWRNFIAVKMGFVTSSQIPRRMSTAATPAPNAAISPAAEMLVVVGRGRTTCEHREGQRQFIQSLSVYARQFLHQLERPDVDLIGRSAPLPRRLKAASEWSPGLVQISSPLYLT